MALAAEADDRDLLVLDQIEIGIPIVINAHKSTPGGFLLELHCFGAAADRGDTGAGDFD
jgi:hypothetical protein